MMKSKSALTRRRDYFGFVFLIPWIIGFALFFAYPLGHSIWMSFQNIQTDPVIGYYGTPVGIGNYVEAISGNEDFLPFVTESLLDLLINVPVCMVFSFFVAVLLRQKFHGNAVAKAIFFLPVILGTGVFLSTQAATASTSNVAIEGAMQEGVGAMQGLQSMNLVKILQDIGIPESITSYITGPVDQIYTVISMSGVQIFIFLAGLNSISPSLYEAAYIEGASGWVAFWKITFPMVSPSIIVNMVYTLIDNFTMSTNETMNFIYDTAFGGNFEFGLSSAMSWIYCVVLAVLVGLCMWIISKRVVYQA
jgi:ABC-type sugar transport system permease subunit